MKDRRDLLKGLAVSTAWATPVVSSVVLPVHAATSCAIGEGCLGPTINDPVYYFDWPGGEGGQLDVVFHFGSCDGDIPGEAAVALAGTPAEATDILSLLDTKCEDCVAELLMETDGPCDFYWLPP